MLITDGLCRIVFMNGISHEIYRQCEYTCRVPVQIFVLRRGSGHAHASGINIVVSNANYADLLNSVFARAILKRSNFGSNDLLHKS